MVRSGLNPDESLLGLLLRVSEANGYPGVRGLRQLANLPRTFLTRPCEWEGLASLLGDVVSPGELADRSYQSASQGKGKKFVGATVSTVDLNLIHPKICPVCLSECGIARRVWDLRLVTTCWRHGCYLVDGCSQCGSRLTWRRKRLLQCDCGSELIGQPEVGAPDKAIAFALLLETLLVNGTNWVDPFPIPVRSLGAICRVVWWFGAELARYENAQPMAIAKPRICVGATIVERGSDVLENWPDSIEELLSGARRSSGASPQGVSPEHILWRIRQTFRGPDFEQMLDDIRHRLSQLDYPVKPNSYFAVR